jgi:hypothetical protein
MPMPETAVDEDDLAPTREDQIGRARQIAAIQAEAIAKGWISRRTVSLAPVFLPRARDIWTD